MYSLLLNIFELIIYRFCGAKKQGIDGRGTPAVRDSLVAFTSLFIAICCESPRARDVLPGAALLSLSTPSPLGITYWGYMTFLSAPFRPVLPNGEYILTGANLS